jgi:hypothetical protein
MEARPQPATNKESLRIALCNTVETTVHLAQPESRILERLRVLIKETHTHLVHGVVCIHGAVHAQHLQALRVVGGEHAQALQDNK